MNIVPFLRFHRQHAAGVLAAFVMAFCHIHSFAQTHTARTVSISANCKGFYEYLPAGYNSANQKFPLIIYCGGAGTLGNGTSAQLAKLLTEGIPYYIKNNQFPATFTAGSQSFSFIVIAPQFVGWPQPADVEAVLNYVSAQGYKVDQSRIYLTGFSAGGNAAWKYPNTSRQRAGKLAAVVPVAGYNYPYVDSGAKYMAAANLPVWALHSNSDEPAPVSWSQNFVNKINSYNPAVRAKITRFSGITHDNTKLYVYNPAYRVDGANVYEWMLRHSRDLPPVARAGADVSITLPQSSVILNGESSADPEGSAITYQWKKISGPSQFSLSGASTGRLTVSNLVSGTYGFELTVVDVNGRTGQDTVLVRVIKSVANKMPNAVAGRDTSVYLPAQAASLNGSASADVDGVIEAWAWTKIAGPSQATLSNASAAVATVTNLAKGTYQFRLTVTDNDGATSSDTIRVTVISPWPNQPPVARAGADISITLPASSVTLSGAASSDGDGTIVSYLWKQLKGPSAATVTGSAPASAVASNLKEGSYSFELAVTDDSSATARDTVAVTVLPQPAVSTRLVKINLYGGANPYSTGGWNNWNVTGETNITSGAFKYSDGQSSGTTAVLSYSQGVPDNGANYGGTMCPPQVLRYGSYSTAATRTLTLKGLNNTLKYDLELYASRANTGNTTVFVVNGVRKSVLTDNNKTTAVSFHNVSPANGQIIISINKQNTFSYINGLVLTELTSTARTADSAINTITGPGDAEAEPTALQLFPNPARQAVRLSMPEVLKGNVVITVTDALGKIVYRSAEKTDGGLEKDIDVGRLRSGLYFVQVLANGEAYLKKFYKQ